VILRLLQLRLQEIVDDVELVVVEAVGRKLEVAVGQDGLAEGVRLALLGFPLAGSSVAGWLIAVRPGLVRGVVVQRVVVNEVRLSLSLPLLHHPSVVNLLDLVPCSKERLAGQQQVKCSKLHYFQTQPPLPQLELPHIDFADYVFLAVPYHSLEGSFAGVLVAWPDSELALATSETELLAMLEDEMDDGVDS
jgi:hypothetical protein